MHGQTARVWETNLKEVLMEVQQGKSEGFDSCDRPSNLTQTAFKLSIFQPVWTWNFMDDLKKKIGRLFYTTSSFQNHWWIQTGVTVWKRSIRVKIDDFFVSHDLEIWWMTLKNNRAHLLYYVKLFASFHHHMWIQAGITVQKPLWPWPLTSDLDLLHGHHFSQW